MTEQEWLTCDDPARMLEFLHERASDRKLRLIVCELIRQDHTAQSTDARQSLVLGEQWADNKVTNEEVRAFSQATLKDPVSEAWMTLAVHASEALKVAIESDRSYLTQQIPHFLRECFGNPFRPATLDPAWLTSDVVALAGGIYAEKAFDRLPILADALQDAGCDNDAILSHCRDTSLAHVRGCWVIDLLTGRG